MTDFDLRPAGPDDRPAVAQLYTLARPGNPATPAILAAEDAAQAAQGALHGRWVAVQRGQIVGAAELLEPLGSVGSGRHWMELVVHPGARGRGVGAALYRVLNDTLAPHQPSTLKAVASEANPSALRFAAGRGFAEVERFWDRTLALTGFDPAPLLRPLPPGLALETLAEYRSATSDPYAALHPLYEEARADLPRAPGETYRPLPRSALEAFVGGLDPRLVLLALQDGVPVGYTALEPSGAPGELVIAMTGVARAARRLGLARALKLEAMARAKTLGWAVIRTTNHSDNAPMLSVNDALGFSREPARLGLVKVWH